MDWGSIESLRFELGVIRKIRVGELASRIPTSDWLRWKAGGGRPEVATKGRWWVVVVTGRGGSTSASPMSGTGVNTKASAKKPSGVQKRPLDSHASSPPLPSKKQKVSGALADQSIEHLNDVTAVSGVNLREEEEQLFSGSKDDSRVSEASRRAVQEEEDRLILQKTPLQKKLAEIS
ncbi:hypothetical protein Cgig2_021159 [Carnegiea gigantea]|uniref:Transcription initiation factor TFIID component TAF4 C-terminal domain-containing protein n=1 Tax=Carnegiea gigantea TaxID=171969 RepID=A0A9Q1QQD4_9CARY|nr:hypothetical protein Cgig2_021159 [Carnegiea gigantea]